MGTRITKKTLEPSGDQALKQALERARELETQMGRVISEMDEKVRQLEILSEISGVLNSSLDPEVVRERAMEGACKLLRCETASILLVDEEKQELYWETVLNDAGRELKRSLRLKLDRSSIAGAVAMSGQGCIVNDPEHDGKHNKKAKASNFRTINLVCVPLMLKGRVIGVLQALNKLPQIGSKAQNGFSETDLSLLQTMSHPVAIAIENARLYGRIKRSFFETVEALAEAIEKKDRYTGGHTKRVVYYSMCIGKYMDLTTDQRETLELAAILHDIGKIGIEDKILKKEAPLSPDEWKVMQEHPALGFDILSRIESLQGVCGDRTTSDGMAKDIPKDLRAKPFR